MLKNARTSTPNSRLARVSMARVSMAWVVVLALTMSVTLVQNPLAAPLAASAAGPRMAPVLKLASSSTELGSGVLIGCLVLLNVVLLIVVVLLVVALRRRRTPGAGSDETSTRRDYAALELSERRLRELSELSNHLQQLSEKEKTNLARELHDQLGGLLIAVKMDASWLHKRWPSPNADIEARWHRIFKVLDDGVEFKRQVVENLHPTLLDNMGLMSAVRWITEETCNRSGLHRTESYPEQELPLLDEVAIMLFRLVQESLNNVVRHAHATQVRIEIGVEEGQLRVSIEDDGIGIEAERPAPPGSHGLATMQLRIHSFGGILDIERVERGGTRVLAHLPLQHIIRPEPTPSAQPATAASMSRSSLEAPLRTSDPVDSRRRPSR